MVDLSLEQWWICLAGVEPGGGRGVIEIFIRRRSRADAPAGVVRTPGVARRKGRTWDTTSAIAAT